MAPGLFVEPGLDADLQDVAERGAPRVLVAERGRRVEQRLEVTPERGGPGGAPLRLRFGDEAPAHLLEHREVLEVVPVEGRLPRLDRALLHLQPLEALGDLP